VPNVDEERDESETTGRPTKEEKQKEIHADALKQYDAIYDAYHAEREQCRQDRRFSIIPGAQYEGNLKEQFKNKPMYEVNKGDLAVQRIVNDYRNNKITADFVPRNGIADDELADMCDGLFRADQQDSQSEEAHNNAFEEAARGGFGAYRLYTEYEDEYDPDNDKQRIRMEPIYDADQSVWFDLDAQRQDKSDAKHCFVIMSKTPSAFKEEYPDDEPAEWATTKSTLGIEYDWYEKDVVRIAEYYKVEDVGETIVIYEGPDKKEERVKLSKLDAEKFELLEATGYREVRRRRVKRCVVHKYILSGNKVLEDCGIIAGEHIPIVPVYWKRVVIDGIERCVGHLRLVKDVQRIKNMLISKLAEISAYSSVKKPILTPEQVSGLEDYWAEDNIKNYAYMLVNPMMNTDGTKVAAGPIGYTEPPQIPEALAALMAIVEQDQKELLGNQQEGEKVIPNISGKAMELQQNYIGMGTFIGHSNMAMSIKREAEIWLSKAKDIYVEPKRKMKTVDTADKAGTIELMNNAKGPEGALVYGNDFSRANMDVFISVGPSTASRREAVIRQITGMMPYIPQEDQQTRSILFATWGMNIEGEGMGGLRDYSRKQLVQMGVEKPTDEERQQMDQAKAEAAKQPDPNAEALMAMAEKAQADAQKALAEVEKIKAQTIEILAKAEKEARGMEAPVVPPQVPPVPAR
jgi:hypothetical protein